VTEYKFSVVPLIENFHKDENDIPYCRGLIEIPEQYHKIKAVSTVEFYTLKGRTTKICKENIVPMFGMWYAIYSPIVKDVPTSDRYYFRQLRESHGYEERIKALRNYVKDGNLWLLMTKDEVALVTETLQRLHKAYCKTEGKLDYHKQYIPLMEHSLAYEQFLATHKSDPGLLSKSKQWEERIKSFCTLNI